MRSPGLVSSWPWGPVGSPVPSGGAPVCRLLSAPRELLPPRGIQCAHHPERTVPAASRWLRSAARAASQPEDRPVAPCLGCWRPFAPFLTPLFSRASALPSLAALPPKHRRHRSRLSTSRCGHGPGCAVLSLQLGAAGSRPDPPAAELSPGAPPGCRSPVWRSVPRSPGAARPVSFPSGRRGPAAFRRTAGRPSLRIPGLWVPPPRLPASACREVLLLDHKSLRTEAVAILPHRLGEDDLAELRSTLSPGLSVCSVFFCL